MTEDVDKYEKKLQPRQVIKCPHCKYEYFASEVLYPDQVVGKVNPSSIIRDPLGHILYEKFDEDALAEDVFTCDNCGKPFIVEIELKLNTKEELPELDMSDNSVSLW